MCDEIGRQYTTVRSVVSSGRACATCDDARMVEYGNGVGQVAGGSGGVGGQAPDMGATLSQMVNDSVTRLGTVPPAGLVLLGAVVLVLGWILLKQLISTP